MKNRLTVKCVLGVFLTLGVAFGLSACGSSSSDTTSSAQSTQASSPTGELASKLPAQFRDAGSIKIATAVGNPPYESVEPGSSEPVGFDIDLITALSEKLGLTPEIQTIPFAGVIPGLQSGRYNVAISSLTITSERTEVINLLAYLEIGTGLLVQKGNPSQITDLAAACGKKLGVAKGSANEIPVKEASAECDGEPIQIVQTEGNDLLALQSGRVEGTAMDAAAAVATAEAQPDAFETPTEQIYAGAPAGIGFPKEEMELAEAFQAALKSMIADGEYTELLEKWGIPNLAHETAEINPKTEL